MYRYRPKDRPHKESVVSKPGPYLAQSSQYILVAIVMVALLVVSLSTNYPGFPSTPPSSFRGITCECAPCKTLLGTYGIPAPLVCTASTCALCASLSQTVAEAEFTSAASSSSSSTSSSGTIANKASDAGQPLKKLEASDPAAILPSTAAAPETPSPLQPVDWLHVQPQKALFMGPDNVFDGTPLRGPTHPRITLQNGERVPMHPLGYVDTDTGKTVEWRVAEGDIISYVWDNEKSHFEVFTKATRECAAAAAAVAGAGAAPPPLFLDIGANHGLYGLLAAARGCAVEFYDPQRKCNDILEKSVGLLPPEVRARPVKVHHAAVGPEGGPAFSTVYGMICAGRFSRADSGAMKPWVGGAGEWGEVYSPFEGFDPSKVPLDKVQVPTLSLDAVIGGRRVVGMKVDVEGYESDVIASGAASFQAHLVDVLVVEVSNEVWHRKGWDLKAKAEPFVRLVRDFGYRVKLLRGREELGDPGDAFHLAGGVGGQSDHAFLMAYMSGELAQRDYLFVSPRLFE